MLKANKTVFLSGSRITTETKEKLKTIAIIEDVPESTIIRKAIMAFLKNYKKKGVE